MTQLTNAQLHRLIGDLLELEPGRRPEWLEQMFPDEPLLRSRLLAAVAAHEQSDEPRIGDHDKVAFPLSSRTPAPLTGLIARYEIIRRLDGGGMGEVYLARDPEVDRTIALKLLCEHLNTKELRSRFRREATAAGKLRHQNIVTIFDVGEYQGRPFIAMEFVPGRTLADMIAEDVKLSPPDRIPLARKLEIIEALCAGLACAHKAALVHRDIKPANIMVDEDGVVKILDFGVANFVNRDELPETRLTLEHMLIGTIGYISPEHLAGASPTSRSDIFAAAVTAYELITGRNPFGTTTRDIVRRTVTGDVTPMSSLAVAVPAAIEEVVLKGLALRPEDRYESASAMQRAFLAARHAISADRDHLSFLGLGPFTMAQATGRSPDGPEMATHLVGTKKTFKWKLATAVTVSLSIALGVLLRQLSPFARSTPPTVSVLVADFENRTGDPVFDGALEQPLIIAMEGASFVTAYPRRDAQRLAQQVKSGAHLDAQTARLVALREGITYVLVGTIGLSGRALAVQVNAIEPSAGRVQGSAKVEASGKGDVLNAVGALAARVRTALGDTTPESAQLAAMETFTAATLAAMREYSLAQDLAKDGRDEDALVHYHRALDSDPKLGRAYSGVAVSAQRLGRSEESNAAWTKALALLDRMSDRERYRTLGAYYLGSARNYEKAAESYTALVQKYPGDSAGYGNLALAHFYLRDFAKAFDEGRRAVAIDPKNVLQRNNLALYAMYAGDFASGSAEARSVLADRPNLETAYLPVVMRAIEAGDFPAALAEYDEMARTGSAGTSLARIGRADLALYVGRDDSAEQELEKGIVEDVASRNTAGAALKRVALAGTYLEQGLVSKAVDEAHAALRLVHDLSVLVPAARILLLADNTADARSLAHELDAQLPSQNRAYAKIILAEDAMRASNFRDAIDLLAQATRFADVWLAHFDLAVAYVQTDHFPEAISELDVCERRRGEITAIFFDDVPSYRYFAPVRYWRGRAQEGLGMHASAHDYYRGYVDLRSQAPIDPLVTDARRRLAAP